MSNEFIARKGLIIGSVSSGTTETNVLVKDSNGLIKYIDSNNLLTKDIYVTGGTYNNLTGIATFQNNSGGTFYISGFFTGTTTLNEIVYFDTTDPNTFGTIFDPNLPALSDTLYVSSVNISTWTYSGI